MSILIIRIKRRISALENQLADLDARLPAHSIPPGLIAEMDLLDEQIQSERKILAELLTEEING
jgi:hypothetical protein